MMTRRMRSRRQRTDCGVEAATQPHEEHQWQQQRSAAPRERHAVSQQRYGRQSARWPSPARKREKQRIDEKQSPEWREHEAPRQSPLGIRRLRHCALCVLQPRGHEADLKRGEAEPGKLARCSHGVFAYAWADGRHDPHCEGRGMPLAMIRTGREQKCASNHASHHMSAGSANQRRGP